MDQKIKELLERYYQGETSLDEERQLEVHFSENKEGASASDYAQFLYFQQKRQQKLEVTSIDIDGLVSQDATSNVRNFKIGWGLGIAASITLLLLGFLGGMVLQSERHREANSEISGLHRDISSLRQMFLISQLKQPSPTERIQGITIASHDYDANPEVITLLVQVLNKDVNSNVRISAANVLAEFASDEEIRNALISSLAHQESLAIKVAIVNGLLKLGTRPVLDSIRSAIDLGYLPQEYAEQLLRELDKDKVKI